MRKKHYQQPLVLTYIIASETFMTGSTGASGEDVPWNAKEMDEFDDEDSEYGF